MVLTLRSVFLLVAVVLFLVSAFGWNPPRVTLQSIGLAFLAAAFLVA